MKIVEENTIVIINGHDLTLDTFVAVARYGTKVQIAEEAIEAMTRSRALAEKIVQKVELRMELRQGLEILLR